MRRITLMVSATLLAGCAAQQMQTTLEQTLDAYEAEIRWGDIAAAARYIDPEQLRTDPPGTLQLARYRQVRVSGYEELGIQSVSDTEVHQRVRIGLINLHTQVERSVIDEQVWTWDPAAEHWWLQSGLPEIVE